MINPKLIILLLACTAILAWACQPRQTPDLQAGGIVEAVNAGNLEKARHLADRFLGANHSLDTVSIGRLCTVSVALIKLADESDNADVYAAQALQCFRKAMGRDSVTAAGFYDAVAPEDYRYVNTLRHLSVPVTAREKGVVYVDEHDEESAVDSLFNPGD